MGIRGYGNARLWEYGNGNMEIGGEPALALGCWSSGYLLEFKAPQSRLPRTLSTGILLFVIRDPLFVIRVLSIECLVYMM